VPAVAGARANSLSISSLTFLALFVLAILVLVVADVAYLVQRRVSLWDILTSAEVLAAIRLSAVTSLVSLLIVIVLSIPVGYALSRYRFRGHSIINAIVDVPIVLPPIVIGLSLLAFFGTWVGEAIKEGLRTAGWTLRSGIGIVLCQVLVAVSYSIRATKVSFDAVDPRLEHVAMSLGCSPWAAFRRVTLPLARSGLIAGSVMAWARAIGVFGPLMVFVGTSEDVIVMPTAMYLELSTGKSEVALAIALVAMLIAGAALAVVHWLVPGRKWT